MSRAGSRRLERLLNAGSEGLCAINAPAANERAGGVTTKVLKVSSTPPLRGDSRGGGKVVLIKLIRESASE